MDDDAGVPNGKPGVETEDGPEVPKDRLEVEDDEVATAVLKAKGAAEDACVGVPKDVPGVLNADAGVPNNGAGLEAGCVGVPKEGPGVDPGWEAAPKDRPLVEDEDVGVAKEKPKPEADDAAGVPKDKLGLEEAGVLKDGVDAEDVGVPNGKPADDAGLLKPKEGVAEFKAAVPNRKLGAEAEEDAGAEDAEVPNENEGAGAEYEPKEKLVNEGAVDLG